MSLFAATFSHLPEHQLRGTPRGSGVKPRGGGSSSWAWGSPPPSRPPPSRPPPPAHRRCTAALLGGLVCGVGLFFSLCEVAFWAAFAYFFDSCAHFCCVGRVQCVLRAVNSVAGVLACVCALRFSIECEFALGGMDASGVFRSGVMYSYRPGGSGRRVYMGYFGIGANKFITHDQPSYLVGSRCEVVVGMLNRIRNRLFNTMC